MNLDTKKMTGLIWITGFSSSGKTTVSRKVNFSLKEQGCKTVFLDGDDLRGIFGNTWGFERSQRIEAAKVYFRLCSHLTAQGYVVIISSISMFQEIHDWVRENITNSIQIMLNVPPDIRIRRDAETKRIYQTKTPNDALYDIPDHVDLAVDNYGSSSPAKTAKKIVAFFKEHMSKEIVHGDKGRAKHWDKFYKSGVAPSDPSPFALDAASKIEEDSVILEMGCGNGRDSRYFAQLGNSVHAFDRSSEAISFCKNEHSDVKASFQSGILSELDYDHESFDVVYSRFVIHSMSKEEETDVLRKSFILLKAGGKIFIECRSVGDQLYRQGDILSHTEKVEGHYRRFIVIDELIHQLNDIGFNIISSIESKGLAVDHNEDPMVIRIEASK